MESGNRIEITDKDGWRKEFILQKRLIYIGNDSRNDIVLSNLRGTGVDPRHLQLVVGPGGAVQCTAVNLSSKVIAMGPAGERQLDSNSAIDVADGETFRLGDFVLVFHLQDVLTASPDPTGREFQQARVSGKAGSTSIGLKIALSQVVLNPRFPIEGTLLISNQGGAPGVQFRLGLDGLPPECYEIGPAPILFPGAEKAVPIRITHPCRPEILAGSRPIKFWADAVEAYPGESAVVSRDIRILPYYSHSLRLIAVD